MNTFFYKIFTILKHTTYQLVTAATVCTNLILCIRMQYVPCANIYPPPLLMFVVCFLHMHLNYNLYKHGHSILVEEIYLSRMTNGPFGSKNLHSPVLKRTMNGSNSICISLFTFIYCARCLSYSFNTNLRTYDRNSCVINITFCLPFSSICIYLF